MKAVRGGVEAGLLGRDASDPLSLEMFIDGGPYEEVACVRVVSSERREGLVEEQGVLMGCSRTRVNDRL